jgi:cobyrinic acid a,c-diamide synthase
MCGKEYVRGCFEKYSADADIAVIEGVMGMYDGHLSTARLAAELGLPVILVVDAYGMAESAGAVVKGFAEYNAEALNGGSTEEKNVLTSDFPNFQADIAGVIFNRIASDRHYERLRNSVSDVPVIGYLPRDIDFKIPHRHLGLVVAEESPIDAKEIDKLANAVLEHIDIEQIVRKCGGAEALKKKTSDLPDFRAPGLKIAVAYDKAFCFYYEDNLDMLRQEGAEIIKFSPLSDTLIPDNVDALYIGGGYPELYAEQLSRNKSMMESIKCFADKGGPVYAECGGFMYLTEGIYDFDGDLHPMAGVFPFKIKMTKGKMRLGYREAVLRKDSILAKKGTSVRGHEFHYSEIAGTEHGTETIYSLRDGSGSPIHDEGYRTKNTFGSYMHMHFGSERSIVKNMVDFIKEHNGKNNYCGTRQS